MTVGEALRKYISVLKQQGLDEAEDDVKVLLCHVLKSGSSWLFAHFDHVLTDNEGASLEDLINRRIDRVPVAYLVRNRGFYGLDLYVDSRVLVPRPETETLVEEALILIREWKAASGVKMNVADVGTGSGAIAIALAVNNECVIVYAGDVSRDALDVAEINIKRHHVEERVIAIQGSLLEQMPVKLDMVVANLPYIKEEELGHLPADISGWEPEGAFNGGGHGIEMIRALIMQCPGALVPGGRVLLEIGAGQEKMVEKMAAEALPYAHFSLIKDLSGRNRVVKISIPEF